MTQYSFILAVEQANVFFWDPHSKGQSIRNFSWAADCCDDSIIAPTRLGNEIEIILRTERFDDIYLNSDVVRFSRIEDENDIFWPDTEYEIGWGSQRLNRVSESS